MPAKPPRQKPGRSKQNYQTPPEFIRTVKSYLDIDAFALDVAADARNAQAKHFYDEANNGLELFWSREGWNWCNPPYSHIAAWVEKAYMERVSRNCSSAVLVPASVGANWWRDWVHQNALVLFLNGRLTFVGETDPYPKDCALLIYSTLSHGYRPGYEIWEWAK